MKKILLIEDDRIIRENTAELLELSNYDVEVAENGKIGVEKARAFLPDLIVCDIMMPELDGYGVLYLLSKEPPTMGIPFVFLTAKSEKADIRKGMEMGADDFLTKPFQDIELLNAVESRLKKHEIFKKQYGQNPEDVKSFLKEAGEMLSLKSLSKNLTDEAYKFKEMIYRVGDYPHFLFLIKEGQIKTYGLNEDGKELITGIYQPGDFFGYQALLEDRTYQEYAEVLQSSKLYKIPKDDFLSLIYKNRDVSNQIIRMISKDLSHKKEELVHLAYSSVRKRVARKLQEIIEDGEDNYTEISRSDLANLVATSKETLIRTLTELKEEKIIDTNGSKIILLNRAKLVEMERAW